jgi:hypothetical protein
MKTPLQFSCAELGASQRQESPRPFIYWEQRPDPNLMSRVVRVAGQDGQGAIDLFGKHNPGELVRQGHWTEGKEKVGSLSCGRGPTVGGTDGEHQTLSALITDASNARREFLRSVLLPAAIQQNGIRWGAADLTVQPIKDRRLGLEELGVAGNVPGHALKIVGEQAVRSL